MCMRRVTKTYKPNDNIAVIYKRMRKNFKSRKTDGLRTPYRAKYLQFGKAYNADDPVNLKYTAVFTNGTFHSSYTAEAEIGFGGSRQIRAYDLSWYDAGFHGYLLLEDAIKKCQYDEVVVECIVWDIRAIGYGLSNNQNIVAKNIRIMRIMPEED